MRFFCIFLMILVCECKNENSTDNCSNVKTSLSLIRKRRHLTFPEGSNVVMSIVAAKSFMTHAPTGWNFYIELDLLYKLPDSTFVNTYWRRRLHHRQKRQFWEQLQTAFDYHNINGRACILRSISEAKNYLAPLGKSLVHDLLRAVFTAPVHEQDFADEIGEVYDELLDPDFYEQTNDCPFSILHFVLALRHLKY